MTTRLFVVGFLLSNIGPALGTADETTAETPPATPTHELDPMVVRAYSEDVDLTYESPALEIATDRITGAELERTMPATASDALAAAPGIHTETRGRKYKQLHSFRGQVYPYPDILLDGIWQREARELFYVFPGAALEGVEIVRTPSTLFHGLADVVGVINLIPRRPVVMPGSPPVTSVGAEAGTFETFRTYGFQEGQAGDGRAFNVGGQYYRTAGPSGRNAGEEISSAFGSFLFAPAAEHRIRLSGWWLHGYRELEMPDPDGPAMNSLKNREERYDPINYGHINLRGTHAASGQATTDWSVFYSHRQARYQRTKIDPAGPGPDDTVADEDDREYGVQAIQGFAITPDNTLRLGVFAHRWTAPEGKQSYVGSRQDVSSFALVLADEQNLGDWTIDAGVRYARSYLHDFSGPAFDLSGTATEARRVTDEWDSHALSGTAGVTVDLDERNRLFAHGGIGERRPGPGAVLVDGSSPDAETRYTADGGWEWRSAADGVRLIRLGGFLVWRQDAIARVNQTGTDAAGNEFYFSENRDIRQRGLELQFQTPKIWPEHVSFFGGLTWMRSEERVAGTFRKFREVPSLIVTGGLQLEAGAWDAALRAKHVNRYENFRFAQDGNYHDLGDYWDLTLSGGLRLGRRENIRLYGVIDNLLDQSYSTVVGWSDPGRRFRIGVEATF